MACLYIKTLWSSYYDVKKILEDKHFGRQDILQFFSGVSKDYKYLKSPKHEIGTLKEVIVVIK